jgi:hypothetical protein
MALDTEGGSVGRTGLAVLVAATEALESEGATGAWARVSANEADKQLNTNPT